MIPFLESSGGNCQDAIILVEVLAARVKLLGGSEGTAIKKFHMIIYEMEIIIAIKRVIMIVILLFLIR